MKKKGLKTGKTEKAIMAFIKKHIGRKIFSPEDLIRADYPGDRRTLLNTLPRLARKGLLNRLCKGTYKNVTPGSKVRAVKGGKRLQIQVPREKLTSEEWRMRIDAKMNKIADEVKTCDGKIEECHKTIKQAQADIEVWRAERKKAEKRMEEFKKVHETFLKSPEGFGEILEALRDLG